MPEPQGGRAPAVPEGPARGVPLGTGSATGVAPSYAPVGGPDEEPKAGSYAGAALVRGRSHWQIARATFLRHKLAVGSLVLLLLIFGGALFAAALTPYDPLELRLEDQGLGPSTADRHFFGTDQLGRDYFTRVLYGIRTTARVAFLVALLSTAIGTVVGAIAGYYGGWSDNLLMRMTDLLLTLPLLVVLLTASALLGSGSAENVAIILAALLWPTLARVVRATFLSLKEQEFTEAARAAGASDVRIMIRELLPNSLGPIIVNATLTVANAILIEAFLSYLGFGIRPPTPALGSLISEGQGSMIDMWWLVTFPGLAIVLICLCINFIGDGLRDAFDPMQTKMRG